MTLCHAPDKIGIAQEVSDFAGFLGIRDNQPIPQRRAEQATEVFRENYAVRGLSRVRVRGTPPVSMAVLLRCAGLGPVPLAQDAVKKRRLWNFD